MFSRRNVNTTTAHTTASQSCAAQGHRKKIHAILGLTSAEVFASCGLERDASTGGECFPCTDRRGEINHTHRSQIICNTQRRVLVNTTKDHIVLHSSAILRRCGTKNSIGVTDKCTNISIFGVRKLFSMHYRTWGDQPHTPQPNCASPNCHVISQQSSPKP